MNKKILLGSIIAVVILVLVSFTGVVGFQTTKSSTIARASPLFSVRSTRAMDKESRDFACDYIGKGEEITIPLLKRDNKTFLLQQIIDRISKIDVKENHKIINALRNLNLDIDDVKKFVVVHDDTVNVPCTVICTWEIYFCYILLLFEIIAGLILYPFYLVATLLERGFCDFWSLACLITWECDI